MLTRRHQVLAALKSSDRGCDDCGVNGRLVQICVICAIAATTGASACALSGTGDAHAIDTLPAVSPDGKSVAFVHIRDDRSRDVHVSRLDRKPRRLTTSGGEWPAWSPDGSKIVFARYVEAKDKWELDLVNSDGTHLHRLTTAAGRDGEGDLAPAWSPDGKTIAFEGDDDIRLINVDGTKNQLLVSNGGEPAWSPDGTKIAFIRPAGRAFASTLRILDIKAKLAVMVAQSARASIQRPAWSPDGRALAFEDMPSDAPSARYPTVTKYTEVYLLYLDNHRRTRLTDNKTFDGSPAWTPDGRIVFERSGRLHVMSSDGTNVRQIFHQS